LTCSKFGRRARALDRKGLRGARKSQHWAAVPVWAGPSARMERMSAVLGGSDAIQGHSGAIGPTNICRSLRPGRRGHEGLRKFASGANLLASHFTAIGAFSDVVFGFFEPDAKRYAKIPMAEQVEVLSLLGNIAINEDRPQIHAHAVVGRRDGAAFGGHLLEAHVRPTLEVILTESPRHLWREADPQTGLARLKAE
jgi:uncharacterized protein